MPAYSQGDAPVLCPGDAVKVWDAETVAAGGKSQALCMAPLPFGGEPLVAIAISFAEVPTDVVSVQTANNDVDGEYVTLAGGDSTNTSPDIFQLTVAARFIRLLMTSQSAGGKVTATIARAT